MRVEDNGNVGIGTSGSPTVKLDVNGKTRTSSLQVGTSSTSGYVLVANDAQGNVEWDQVDTEGIRPNIVSQIDNVVNDGGNIDLVAQGDITITPDNTNKTISFNVDVPSSVGWTEVGEPRNILVHFNGTTIVQVYARDGSLENIDTKQGWTALSGTYWDRAEHLDWISGHDAIGIKILNAYLHEQNAKLVKVRLGWRDADGTSSEKLIYAGANPSPFYKEISANDTGGYDGIGGIITLDGNGDFYIMSQNQNRAAEDVTELYVQIFGYIY
jgi:hypothetical protein